MCINVSICFDIELMTIMDLEYAYLIAGEHRVFQVAEREYMYLGSADEARFIQLCKSTLVCLQMNVDVIMNR